MASLFVFNRNEAWDETAFYFFGSYGLGVLSYWASKSPHRTLWLVLLGMLVIAALLTDFRHRIAVAGVAMLMLGLSRQYGALSNLARAEFPDLSRAHFLLHIPCSLSPQPDC